MTDRSSAPKRRPTRTPAQVEELIGQLRRQRWTAPRIAAELGITVERVMTDNGTGYRSKVHRAGVAELGIKHLRTQPYRPRTNGKAERFIQTLQREWAYAAYQSSWQRRRALTPWLSYYNCRRPHRALGHKTPASQIN